MECLSFTLISIQSTSQDLQIVAGSTPKGFVVGRCKDQRRRVSRHRLWSKRTLPYSSRSCRAPESLNQMNIHDKLPHETKKDSVTLWKASNNRPWSIMCFNWIWCSAGVSSTTAGVTARDWIWAACWKWIDNKINDEIKNKKNGK